MKSNVRRSFVARVGAPFVDESLLGYVSRALSVTAVRQLPTMLRLADAPKPNSVAMPTTLVDPGEIERIAVLFGCEVEDIASRTYAVGTFEHSGTESLDFFGTQIRHHYRECKIRRVSPRALEIAQYHRAIWEIRPLSFDPQTRESDGIMEQEARRAGGVLGSPLPAGDHQLDHRCGAAPMIVS
jgi:hypothetical protein